MRGRSVIGYLTGAFLFAVLQAAVSVHAQDSRQSPPEGNAEHRAKNDQGADPLQAAPSARPVWRQFQLLPPLSEPETENRQPDDTKAGGEQKAWYDRFILDHITDWLLVLFNGLLVAFTYKLHKSTKGLWDAARVQGEDMKASIAAGEKAADAALNAANVAERSLVISQRAWLKVGRPVISASLRFREYGASTAIKLRLTNIGNAPALKIATWIRLGAIHPDGTHVKRFHKECDDVVRMPPPGEISLYPGDSIPEDGMKFNIFAQISKQDIEAALFETDNKKHVLLLLLGCILYQFPSDPGQYHQTRFMYQIVRDDLSLFYMDLGSLPAEILHLKDAAFGSALYAD